MKKVLFPLYVLCAFLFLLVPLASNGAIIVQTATGTTGPATPTWDVIGTYTDLPTEMPPKGTVSDPLYTTSTGSSVVITDYNSGFLTVATPSFDVLTTAKTDIAALLPTGATGFILYAYNGDLVVGPSSGIATGALPVGVLVASGAFVKWDGLVSGNTNNISAYGNTGTVNCRLVAW